MSEGGYKATQIPPSFDSVLPSLVQTIVFVICQSLLSFLFFHSPIQYILSVLPYR